MRYLLINPWIYDSSAYDFWLKPLGLLYVGEILRKLGHEIILIDLLDRYDKDMIKKYNPKEKQYGTGKFYSQEVEKPEVLKNIPRKFKRYGFSREIFEKKLSKIGQVDGILISITMTYWYYGGIKVVEILHNYFPNTPIFLGGIYSTILPNHAVKTFAPLKVRVLPGQELTPIKNMLSYYGEKLEYFDWFEEINLEYKFYESKLPYVVILSSLGCTFNCSYCITPKIWKYKYRKIENVIKNIDDILIKKPSVKNIVFFDDAFLLRKDIKAFLNELSHFEINFHLPNGIHTRLVNEKIANLLAKANFKTIRLGYETYNEKLQKETGGKVTNRDLKKSVNYLLNAGIDPKEISAYIILNLPGQEEKDVYKAIDYCTNLGINVSLNEFTPIPTTSDYKRLIKIGWLSENTDPILLNNTYIPYWWNYGMNAEKIHKIKMYYINKKAALL